MRSAAFRFKCDDDDDDDDKDEDAGVRLTGRAAIDLYPASTDTSDVALHCKTVGRSLGRWGRELRPLQSGCWR